MAAPAQLDRRASAPGRGTLPPMSGTAAERAARAVARVRALAPLSEQEGGLTRRYGSQALVQTMAMAEEWLRGAGLATSRDGIGNLLGRLEGATPGLPALVLGSHLDSVADAGIWDGPLGVVLALDQAERCAATGAAAGAARGTALPFALEVAAFADEEGLRFPTAYLGSQVWAGLWDDAQLELRDAGGVTVHEAVLAMGGDPARIAQGARRPEELLGWCEVHIEQGTRLERAGVPLGVVTAIQGQSRCTAVFTGQAGHAGTTAMDARRDALLAAAEWALAVEAEGRATPGLVATVGRLQVEPGAANVIPGLVSATLDARHPDDAVRQAATATLEAAARRLAAARGVGLEWRQDTDNAAVVFSPRLCALLHEAAAGAQGAPAPDLPSGAGHDAVPLSRITEVSMLFVRCRDGISHNPLEHVEEADVAAAIAALDRLIDQLAAQLRAG